MLYLVGDAIDLVMQHHVFKQLGNICFGVTIVAQTWLTAMQAMGHAWLATTSVNHWLTGIHVVCTVHSHSMLGCCVMCSVPYGLWLGCLATFKLSCDVLVAICYDM